MRRSHCSNKKVSQSWLLWLCLFCSPSFSRFIIPLWLHFTPIPLQPLNQLDEREVFRGNSSCSSLYRVKLRPCPSGGQSWQDTRRPTTLYIYIYIGLSHTQYTLWPAIRSFRTVSTSSSGHINGQNDVAYSRKEGVEAKHQSKPSNDWGFSAERPKSNQDKESYDLRLLLFPVQP